MLLYEVFDIKWLWGDTFKKSRELDGGIFEDKNLDIKNRRERTSGKTLGGPKDYKYPLAT